MPREDTQFQIGNKGGPGRRMGSKNRLSEDFLQELHAVFIESGGEAIRTMCKNSPNEFVRVCAGLVPRELLLEVAQERPSYVINASPTLTSEEWVEKFAPKSLADSTQGNRSGNYR